MPPERLDRDRRQAILRAALEVVAESGFDRLTMDALATRARASKATLYRHWAGKAELVADAVRHRQITMLPEPDTGSVREDLLESLRALSGLVRDQDMALTQGLLTAMRSQPELARCMRGQMLGGKRSGTVSWVQREISRGNLPPGADAGVLLDVSVSMVLVRLFVTGEPVDEPFFVRVVDDVVLPLLLRPRTPREDHVDGRHHAPDPIGPAHQLIAGTDGA